MDERAKKLLLLNRKTKPKFVDSNIIPFEDEFQLKVLKRALKTFKLNPRVGCCSNIYYAIKHLVDGELNIEMWELPYVIPIFQELNAHKFEGDTNSYFPWWWSVDEPYYREAFFCWMINEVKKKIKDDKK